MKLEQQVCTLDQAKKLKELGVYQESLCHWQYYKNEATPILVCIGRIRQLESKIQVHHASAFTVAELGVMLPHFDNLSQMGGFVHLTEFDPSVQDGNPWYCVWEYDKDKENAGFGREIIDGETEAQARAAMLIYCLERQLTTAEEVNQRLNN